MHIPEDRENSVRWSEGEPCGRLHSLDLGAVNVMGGGFTGRLVGVCGFSSLAAAAADSSAPFRISICVVCEFLPRTLDHMRRENRFIRAIIARHNLATGRNIILRAL